MTVSDSLTEIRFPDWANEALLSDEKMVKLIGVILKQVAEKEPVYVSRSNGRPDYEISPSQNPNEYWKAVHDRTLGTIGHFFNPITLNIPALYKNYLFSGWVTRSKWPFDHQKRWGGYNFDLEQYRE